MADTLLQAKRTETPEADIGNDWNAAHAAAFGTCDDELPIVDPETERERAAAERNAARVARLTEGDFLRYEAAVPSYRGNRARLVQDLTEDFYTPAEAEEIAAEAAEMELDNAAIRLVPAPAIVATGDGPSYGPVGDDEIPF